MAAGECAFCEKEFVRWPGKKGESQRFCSHSCAMSFHHGTREITAQRDASELVNGDNPRYTQDERGQWWYHGAQQRTRAKVRACTVCGREFLFSVYRSGAMQCSQSCGQKAFNKANPARFRGDNSKRWKGGKQTRHGYMFIHQPEHPSCQGNKRAYVAEHRLVMEKMIGRYLTSDEQVHHKNGVRSDNRPENLELWVGHQPKGQRVGEVIKHCPTCTCHEPRH